MPHKDRICKACDGEGLLMDDEEWRYTCSVCGGDGIIDPGESLKPSEPFSVDEMNRTLE
ncbi:hypothetical protein [Tuberibacillus sp. Marseille-P3662]|uniref:hypothetical protein n=1 Tax=Tuberibacillus sp. Marseille-P3662 TaxID=1965358 RepID=UPI0015940A6D|nr:hypothetical protein [Tuberibacillus sp. Marseille-P3662]